MRRPIWIAALTIVAVAFAIEAAAGPAGRPTRERARPGSRQANAPKTGETVADFALKDTSGTTVRLSDFKEKIFVLEMGACT